MTTSLTFKTAAIALAVTTMAFASPAAAHDNGYAHTHQRSGGGDQLLGAGLGAIAGGVLGSQLAANGARTEGSVLGAVLGGVAGAAIAGDGRSSRRGYYNGGYNQSGYYTGGYNQSGYSNGGGYYQTVPSYGYNTYPSQPVYGTVYPPRTYTTTSHYYGSPYYSRPAYTPYYRTPRTGLTISFGNNGGYYDRGYSRRGYTRRTRGHRHTRSCGH